jgi:HPt (histidine-containing phosphotransfer) domain-containing protein
MSQSQGAPPATVQLESREEIESRLKALAGETDPGFAREIVEEFRANAWPMLSDLREALIRSDTKLAGRLAHTLKSNCATFGLARLAYRLRDMEIECRQESPHPISLGIEGLLASFKAADAQLEQAAALLLPYPDRLA